MEERTEHGDGTDQDSLTYAVVSAIAAEKGVPPESVAGRIHEAVDTDGLNRIFAPVSPETPRQNGRLSFEVAGYEVVVEGGELVMVTPVRTGSEESQTGSWNG